MYGKDSEHGLLFIFSKYCRKIGTLFCSVRHLSLPNIEDGSSIAQRKYVIRNPSEYLHTLLSYSSYPSIRTSFDAVNRTRLYLETNQQYICREQEPGYKGHYGSAPHAIFANFSEKAELQFGSKNIYYPVHQWYK